MIMAIIATACLVIALIICLIYGIKLIIIAFEESTSWGLLYLFVPFANIVFIIKYWEECKYPFLKGFLAIPFFIVAMIIWPNDQSEMTANSDNSIEFITSTDSNCKVHNPNPEEGESITWSGNCEDGYAEGNGVVKWYESDKLVETDTGLFIKGSLNGMATVEAHGEFAYKGNVNDYGWSGYGELTYVLGNAEIEEWKNEGIGKYLGKNYVVKGLFVEGYLEVECEKSECPK